MYCELWLWHFGTVELWHCGTVCWCNTVALWKCGTVALCASVVRILYIIQIGCQRDTVLQESFLEGVLHIM